MTPSDIKRVLVLGPSGSGKSTLARRVGEILSLPVIHLDALFWKPGWIKPNLDEFYVTVDKLAQADEFVIDGIYKSSLAPRIKRTHLVLVLDVPRIICTYRVYKRALQYRGKQRVDMASGCEEGVDIELLKLIWRYPKDFKPEINRLLDESAPDGLRVVRLKGKDIVPFLARLSEGLV